MRRLVSALCFFGILSLVSPAMAGDPPDRRLLMIGIDGCRTDALLAAETPHLDRLIANGNFSTNTSILGPRPTENDTVSGPGWSSIYTGVWADKHEVNNNEFADPNYDEYPHFFALLKEARPKAVAGSFSDWSPIAEKIVSAADVVASPAPGKDGGADGYRAGDIAVTQQAAAFLRQKDPTAVCVYLGQVDETGHAKGFHPTVPEYIAAIERVDAHIGTLLEAIAARPNADREEWLVVVTTDHGGQGTGHGDGAQVEVIRRVFLIVSGPGLPDADANRQTFLVDAVPTGLTWLGVEVKSEWGLDGTPYGLAP